MRILNIVPCNADVFTPDMEAYLRTHLGEETVIESVRLQEGKPSIEGEYDEMVNSPHVVELAIRGEKNGCDAVFINCFGDPGVRAARECVDIPVFGGFEPAVLLALGLGDRIGIVTVVPNVVPLIRRNVAAAQLDGRIVTARNVGIPVLALTSTGDLSAAIAAERSPVLVRASTGMPTLRAVTMRPSSCAAATFLLIRGTTLGTTVTIPILSPSPSARRTAGSKPPKTGMSTHSLAARTPGSPKQLMNTASQPFFSPRMASSTTWGELTISSYSPSMEGFPSCSLTDSITVSSPRCVRRYASMSGVKTSALQGTIFNILMLRSFPFRPQRPQAAFCISG